MKPEDQNPTTNPVAPTGAASTPDSGTAPDLAATASDPTTPTTPTAPDPATTSTAPDPTAPVSTPDPATQSPDSLSAADQLAAAQEDLTAAAAVVSPLSSDAGTSSAAPSLDLTSSSPTASSDADASQPIFSEPLQPAAPVPGSIGSVTSVPPVDTPAPTDPSTDNAFATAAAAEPAATPFNPFAQPAPDASTPTANTPATPAPLTSSDPTNPFAPASSDPAGLNPTFQPATSAKPAHTGSKLSLNVKNPTLLLGIAAGIFFVAAVVFAILFINALNNKEVVYYPEVVEPEPEVSTLSCTQTQDLGYLAGYATPVNGTRTIVATYTDDDLTALTVNYQAVYVNEADANLARTNLESSQSALIAAPETSFTAEYRVDGAAMFADIQSIEGQLTNDAAETLLFGSVSGNPEAMARPSLSTSLSAAGAVCTVE